MDPSNTIVCHDSSNDRYGIKYTELISPIIKAVQELFKLVKGDEARLVAQEKDLASLKADIAAKDERLRKTGARKRGY